MGVSFCIILLLRRLHGVGWVDTPLIARPFAGMDVPIKRLTAAGVRVMVHQFGDFAWVKFGFLKDVDLVSFVLVQMDVGHSATSSG